MRETFNAYFPELIKREGGYVDHPRDPGGATNWGITLATLQAARSKPVSKQDVRNLTQVEARSIYRANYWDAIKADDLPAGLDALAFDIAVNHGVGRWRQWAPLAKGLSPQDAIRAITERRRRFYRSLPTFKTFGKGWMRRADGVEAWALRWADKHVEDVVSEPKPKTMATSKIGNGSILLGGAAAANPVINAVNEFKNATDAVSGVMQAGPWAIIAVLLICIAVYVWLERRKKLVVEGV